MTALFHPGVETAPALRRGEIVAMQFVEPGRRGRKLSLYVTSSNLLTMTRIPLNRRQTVENETTRLLRLSTRIESAQSDGA